MKLLAISDLHLENPNNRRALDGLPAHSPDWLILGGDICNTREQLAEILPVFVEKFARVIWVPGNHELWVNGNGETSVDKYHALVDICRQFNVVTPEDPYPLWEGEGGPCLIAPLHLLYDYSFRPDHIPLPEAVEWARESGVMCTDEALIDPAPFESKEDWCRQRLDYTQQRLKQYLKQGPEQLPLVLVNHFPLRYDLVRTQRIPRFSIWCGTRHTEDWHKKYPVKVAVSGHLHMRCTDYRDGVRFEEVSLGYPRDWQQSHGMAAYFREILPGPVRHYDHAGPFWKFRL